MGTENTVEWQGNWYTVVERIGNKLKVYPRGGGFERTIPARGAKPGIPPVERSDRLAMIDGSDKKYPCKADSHYRWNGWAVPSFTLEVVKEILKDVEVPILKETENRITFGIPGEENVVDRGDGDLWTFDGWCWDLVEEQEGYPETAKVRAPPLPSRAWTRKARTSRCLAMAFGCMTSQEVRIRLLRPRMT
jgi:hypothetical protein